MPYFQFNGKKVSYLLKRTSTLDKKRKAIIFIHGSGGNSNSWKNQMSGLNVDFDLIALDLPSHGNSEVFEPLSLRLYVEVVKKLIKDLNLEQVLLCGHSLGGAIIQSYYFKYPNEVSGLILVGTGGRLRVSPIILDSLSNNYQKFLDDLASGAFYRKTSSSIVLNYLEETSKIPANVTLADFKICDAFDTLDKTDTIDINCLIICGKQDRLTPVKYSHFFHEKIPSSELVVINGAGHMVMLEKSSEFNSAIESFIKKYY